MRNCGCNIAVEALIIKLNISTVRLRSILCYTQGSRISHLVGRANSSPSLCALVNSGHCFKNINLPPSLRSYVERKCEKAGRSRKNLKESFNHGGVRTTAVRAADFRCINMKGRLSWSVEPCPLFMIPATAIAVMAMIGAANRILFI